MYYGEIASEESMNSDYYDQKIKYYIHNILLTTPSLITDPFCISIWHEMFNQKDLMTISKEISKMNKKINFDFFFNKMLATSSTAVRKNKVCL